MRIVLAADLEEHEVPARWSVKAAAEAALCVFKDSALGREGGVYDAGTPDSFAVRFHTDIVASDGGKFVFNMIITPQKIMSSIVTEPTDGLAFGMKEDPPTEAGAIEAAARLVAWVRSRSIDAANRAPN